MKLRLHTISPIHIGTGEELAPLDYVVHQNTFYRITQEQLLKLTRALLPETGAKDLGDWVSQQFEQMSETNDNRMLSQINERMNAYYFFQSKNKSREFVQAIRDPKYAIEKAPVELDERTKSRYRGKHVTPLRQVRTHTKNGQGRPYIPGSSLKGSLRTALFFHYLSHHADKNKIARLIQEQLMKKERKERFGLPLSHEAFFCSTKDVHKDRIKYDDEKMDLMKLVRITDAKVSGADNNLHLAKMNIYLVERQEDRSGRGEAATFKANQQPQASYCEVIPADRLIEAELDFDIEFLLQVKGFIQNGGIPSGGDIQWIGIESKVKNLFGLDLATLNAGNKEQKKEEVLQHLMQCWAAFSRRQVAAHRQWFDHFKKNDPGKSWSPQVESGMQPVAENAQRHLIHLGYATGFQGMTAILYFMEDMQLTNLYKRVLEQFGIGNKPGNKGSYKVNMDRFPKSRRLLETEQGEAILPLGWLRWLEDGEDVNTVQTSTMDDSTAIENMAPPPPPEPQYFTGKLNYQKPPELDAVVTVSGRPNKVKVFITPDYSPELTLNGYANPIDVGTVIVVRSQLNKEGKVLQVSFGKRK